MFNLQPLRHISTLPFATFRQDAEFSRYRAIADMARLAAGSTRSQMTHLYGPAVCCKPDVSNGEDWSCASVSGP